MQRHFFEKMDEIFIPFRKRPTLFHSLQLWGLGKFCPLMQTNGTFIHPYLLHGWSYRAEILFRCSPRRRLSTEPNVRSLGSKLTPYLRLEISKKGKFEG